MSHANAAQPREISATAGASSAPDLDALRGRLALRERVAPGADRPRITVVPLPGAGRRAWIADLFAG